MVINTCLTAVKMKRSDAHIVRTSMLWRVLTIIQIKAPKETKVYNGMKKHKNTICKQIFPFCFLKLSTNRVDCEQGQDDTSCF